MLPQWFLLLLISSYNYNISPPLAASEFGLKVLDSMDSWKELIINFSQHHGVCVKKKILSCLIIDIKHNSRDSEILNVSKIEWNISVEQKCVSFTNTTSLYLSKTVSHKWSPRKPTPSTHCYYYIIIFEFGSSFLLFLYNLNFILIWRSSLKIVFSIHLVFFC